MPFDANNVPLTEARLTLPLTGNWTADLSVPKGFALLTGAVTLRIGSIVLQGTAYRSGERGAGRYVLMHGGRGGLINTVPAQSFRQLQLSALLSGLLSSVGETLAQDSDTEALSAYAMQWVRLSQRASEQVQAVAKAADRNWRVKPDGSIWVGADTFPAAKVNGVLMDEFPEQGRRVYGTLEPSLLPGTTVDGWPIATVEHFATSTAIRTVVYRT